MSTEGDHLELLGHGGPPRIIPLRAARVQIGRAAACDVRLGGGYVSRRHARIEREARGTWRVMDLGSANGTRVNGQRIQVANVSDGDVLVIGTHRMVLHLSSAAVAANSESTVLHEREIVPFGPSATVVEQPAIPAEDRLVSARLLAHIHDAGRRLSRLPDVSSVLTATAEEFRSVLRPSRLAIGREDGPRCEWPVVMDGDGRPSDGSDLPQILVPRVDALHGSLAVSWAGGLSPSDSQVTVQGSRSLLFPIAVGARRLGHVYVELDPDRPASSETVDLLALLARQTALVWENLELQAARRLADQMNHELSAARQIQLQLFPGERDLDPRVEIAAENVPALGISGDYYDFRLLAPGRVVFILADVMGHGLSAALLMASVQAVFRLGVRAGWGLLDLDRHLHELVLSSGGEESFVTGLLGICDLADHSLTMVSAGHKWPSIRVGASTVQTAVTASSLPWGLFTPRTPTANVVALAEGDWSVVAYTDGVSESPLANGRTYGSQRVEELHRRHRGRSADEICDEILNDVFKTSDDSCPQQDDITLLVLRSARQGASVATEPLGGNPT